MNQRRRASTQNIIVPDILIEVAADHILLPFPWLLVRFDRVTLKTKWLHRLFAKARTQRVHMVPLHVFSAATVRAGKVMLLHKRVLLLASQVLALTLPHQPQQHLPANVRQALAMVLQRQAKVREPGFYFLPLCRKAMHHTHAFLLVTLREGIQQAFDAAFVPQRHLCVPALL